MSTEEKEQLIHATAVVTRDLCIMAMEEIRKRLNKPVSPIEMMVDQATGYGASQAKIAARETLALMKRILRCERRLGWPTLASETAVTVLSEHINAEAGR